MKAPDKIYLGVDKDEKWDLCYWTTKSPQEQKFSELAKYETYIRKDALLEWAEGCQKIVDSKMRANPCQDLATKSVMWSVFISQINSM